jgi:hypothetical protein
MVLIVRYSLQFLYLTFNVFCGLDEYSVAVSFFLLRVHLVCLLDQWTHSLVLVLGFNATET